MDDSPAAARRALLCAALSALAACAVVERPQEPARPNILLVFVDDLGWKDTGFMGSDFYETPHLDRLASEGMVFTNAYSAAANCAPARASLLTGQYTPRHRIFNVGTGPRGQSAHRRLRHVPGTDTLDPGLRTWAHQLQSVGYTTASIGKWHVSGDPRPHGFDVNVGGTHRGAPTRGYEPPYGDLPGLQQAPEGEYLTDRLSDEAIRFIRANCDRPWMLYLTHFAVHTPLDPKRELLPHYESKPKGALHDHVAMATMIQAVDDGVGRIRAVLDELGLARDTAILFFSDNGGYGPATDMAPLLGYKGTYYEGGIRVPFSVTWPGVVRPGSVSDEPVIGVDLFPTLLDMAGAPRPEGQPVDGLSLMPLLDGSRPSLGERPLFWHFPAYLQSYAGTVDEQRDSLFRSRPCGVVRLGRWKLHEFFEDGAFELYDLREDPGERRDLAASRPEKVEELAAVLAEWRLSIDAPVPTEPNPEFDAEEERRAALAASSSAAGELRDRDGGAVSAREAPRPRTPNVVLIIADDQAWTDFGFTGHPVIETPSIDALAREGATFTRGYVPTALCRPSLATLATGLYAHQHGLTGNDPALPPEAQRPYLEDPGYRELNARLIAHIDRVPTLPRLLADRGYLSFQSGKWWEGSYARGGFTHGMSHGDPDRGGRHGDEGLAIGREGLQPIFDFIESAGQKPFFVWYAPFLPHTPHDPPERLLEKYRVPGRAPELARYYAMCEWLDETVGALMSHLRERGLDDTLVVFVTDNGWIQRTEETPTPPGWFPRFAPRSKQSPYEGGTRTPIILRWPSVIEPARYDTPVSSIDIAPTILHATGSEVPATLPGVNLLDVAAGRTVPRATVFGEGFAHDVADVDDPSASLLYRWCIQDRWKLILTEDGAVGRFAVVHPRTDRSPQLYDLSADPHETTDVAARHPEIVARLSERIERWWRVP